VKRLSVVVTESAARSIREASEWWQNNREAAPTALTDDLERALALIAVQPGIGARAVNVALPGVRRVLLARIRYHLYYRIATSGNEIQVLAFWHTSRVSGAVIPDNP
jgi:plasmid stabilization system protein ParE